MNIKSIFKLKKACNDCPFRVNGAVELHPDRLPSIIASLLCDDYNSFHCHKTVHSDKGGEWTAEGEYIASGEESLCFGSMVYLHKEKQPSVIMRLGLSQKLYSMQDIKAEMPNIINPIKTS